MDNTNLKNSIYSLGLTGSGIGTWWIKKEDGKYFYYHTESSSAIYGQSLDLIPPAEVYGQKWEKTAKKVFSKNSSYKNIVLNTTKQLKSLLNGEIDSCTYSAPWLDMDGKIIWLMDKVYLVDREKDNTAKTVIGITINESLRLSRREKYHEIEEINIKLRSANERAIDLANLSVWSMNYEEFPKGDYVFCNDTYSEALGIDKNKYGYVKFSEISKTGFVDLEGARSMQGLLDNFSEVRKNMKDEFLAVLVKHKNLKTGLPVFLEHYTRVDDRYKDGKLKRVSGYVINITDRVRMERENEELERKNKELLLAQKLAVSSGKVMIWFLNSENSPNNNYFFGNELLFEKLGLHKYKDNRFIISDFNNTLYTEDQEGIDLREKYLAMDDLIEDNKLQTYSKILVKHQNLKTKEIFYFEHNFIVEERYENNTLKIRGGFMADVTNETIYRKRIEYLVKHDLVTGLKNRNYFEEFTKSSDIPKSYTLIVIDIDGLKFINDAFGHLSGDKVIKILGKVLKETFSDNSSIFRVGGDEFTVITNETDQNKIDKLIKQIKDEIYEKSSNVKLSFDISVGYEIVTNNDIDFNSAFTTAENIMYRRKLSIRNSRKSHTLDTVLETLNNKTEETKAHCDRLGEFAVMVLKELGFSRTSDLDDMQLLCQVHDVGKITISEEILSKPSSLTKEEFGKIRSHAESGYKIVRNIVESDAIANGVLYHHERFDGKGYPFGLKGDEIPLFAKIVSVCDSYDVMVTGRPYQKQKSHEEAIEEIKKYSGTQFDPKIADAFVAAYAKRFKV